MFPINATLIFKIPNGTITVEPATGNAIEPTVDLIVKASFSSAKGSFDEIPGLDPSSMLLEGRSIAPKFLPPTVHAGMRATATITDPATGRELVGEFVLDPIVPSRYKPVTRTLGSPLKGVFTQH